MTYTCNLCGQVFEFASKLKEHQKRKNSCVKQIFRCYRCNEIFSFQSHLTKHQNRKTPCKILKADILLAAELNLKASEMALKAAELNTRLFEQQKEKEQRDKEKFIRNEIKQNINIIFNDNRVINNNMNILNISSIMDDIIQKKHFLSKEEMNEFLKYKTGEELQTNTIEHIYFNKKFPEYQCMEYYMNGQYYVLAIKNDTWIGSQISEIFSNIKNTIKTFMDKNEDRQIYKENFTDKELEFYTINKNISYEVLEKVLIKHSKDITPLIEKYVNININKNLIE